MIYSKLTAVANNDFLATTVGNNDFLIFLLA